MMRPQIVIKPQSMQETIRLAEEAGCKVTQASTGITFELPTDKRQETTLSDHYLPEAQYEILLQALLHPEPSLDPRGQLIETLGELGGVWPVSCQRELQTTA